MIKCEDLSYVYGDGTPFVKTALDNVNLEIKDGEFLGIIGHTGSGKSTLLKQFNGLLKPSSGRVLVDGQDIWGKDCDLRKVRFKIGLVFQYPEYQLFEETVFKDIAFGPKNMGMTDDEIEKTVKESMDIVGLSHELCEKSPFELSGGQKRRVAIAGVIAMQPSVLVLDEPTAGLDPKGRDEILWQLKQYHIKKPDRTVILVSHNMDNVAKICSNVLVMNKGKVFMHDTVENVFMHSDELIKIGLDIPQVTKIFLSLKKKGYDVRTDIFTPEQARDEILKVLKIER